MTDKRDLAMTGQSQGDGPDRSHWLARPHRTLDMTTDEQLDATPSKVESPSTPEDSDANSASATEAPSPANPLSATDVAVTAENGPADMAVTKPVVPAAEDQPTPSVAEMLAASQPPATVVPETNASEAGVPAAQVAEAQATEPPTTETPTTEAQSGAETTGAEKPSERIRQKLGSRVEDKPRGSQDLKAVRPETPKATEPVGIPESDELDGDLEAEISAAMGTATVPTRTVPPPVDASVDAAVADAKPAVEPEEIGPGSKVTGTIQHIHGDDVFLNAGLLADVVVSLKQFPADKPPQIGATQKVVIELMDEDGLFRARLPQARSKGGGNWDGLATGQIVDCMVTATNKGGLQVTVSNIKGFLPASQVDLGYVADLEQYVGQKLTVQITEVKPKKRNLVVSRRALLQAERESSQGEFLEGLEPGQDFTGTVKTLKNYGAFVNLGPIDGFLHVGEISWSRINHPNEVLKEGQQVQVRVLKFDKEKNRISLGMKQLVQNPWQGLNERYPSERIVSGKVTRISDFGAFVELEPGVEGLVHISELAWRRVGSVGEVLKVGEEKEFKVLEVDSKRKRVSLSLKALEQKPEAMRKTEAAEAEEEEARPVRRPSADLRGGTGGNSGNSGLFGNPSDFT
ncbi:MAG: S1 RNA-binding domain-containing protein [Planctomycetaceae bacterium]